MDIFGSFYSVCEHVMTESTSFQSGLILSEAEWGAEWNGLLKLASTKPRTGPGDNNGATDHAR